MVFRHLPTFGPRYGAFPPTFVSDILRGHPYLRQSRNYLGAVADRQRIVDLFPDGIIAGDAQIEHLPPSGPISRTTRNFSGCGVSKFL